MSPRSSPGWCDTAGTVSILELGCRSATVELTCAMAVELAADGPVEIVDDLPGSGLEEAAAGADGSVRVVDGTAFPPATPTEDASDVRRLGVGTVGPGASWTDLRRLGGETILVVRAGSAEASWMHTVARQLADEGIAVVGVVVVHPDPRDRSDGTLWDPLHTAVRGRVAARTDGHPAGAATQDAAEAVASAAKPSPVPRAPAIPGDPVDDGLAATATAPGPAEIGGGEPADAEGAPLRLGTPPPSEVVGDRNGMGTGNGNGDHSTGATATAVLTATAAPTEQTQRQRQCQPQRQRQCQPQRQRQCQPQRQRQCQPQRQRTAVPSSNAAPTATAVPRRTAAAVLRRTAAVVPRRTVTAVPRRTATAASRTTAMAEPRQTATAGPAAGLAATEVRGPTAGSTAATALRPRR